MRGLRAMQLLEDISILLGIGVGLALGVVGGLFTSPIDGVAAASIGTWIDLIEAATLFAVPAMLLAAFLPRQRQIYTVTTSNPKTAPAIVTFNSFRFIARRPNYLTFNISQGQLIVLTRSQRAPQWKLFDAADAQAELHLHNFEVLIWNLTRLSSQLTRKLSIVDSAGNFSDDLQIGQLLISAKANPGQAFPTQAVMATNNVLFQNDDLLGLMTRTASRAFNRALERVIADEGGVSGRIDLIRKFLSDAPTNATILRGIDLDNNLRPVDLSKARLEAIRSSAMPYLERLEDWRLGLESIVDSARQHAKSLGALWREEMAAEIRREDTAGTSQRAADTVHIIQLLELVGLRVTSDDVQPIGGVVTCAARLETVKAEVTKLVDDAMAQHDDTTKTLETRIAAMELHAVRPGSLPRHYEEAIVIKRLSQQTSAIRNVPPAIPNSERPDPDQRDDDEPLN